MLWKSLLSELERHSGLPHLNDNGMLLCAVGSWVFWLFRMWGVFTINYTQLGNNDEKHFTPKLSHSIYKRDDLRRSTHITWRYSNMTERWGNGKCISSNDAVVWQAGNDVTADREGHGPRRSTRSPDRAPVVCHYLMHACNIMSIIAHRRPYTWQPERQQTRCPRGSVSERGFIDKGGASFYF